MIDGARLIGFGHRAQVGKDSAAEVLVGYGWKRLAFADPIRHVLADMDGNVARLVNAIGWEEAKGLHHVRGKLHATGEILRRRLGKDCLINYAMSQVTDGTVITDVRYPEEAEAILALGGSVVRIDRDAAPVLRFPSEHQLDGWDKWTAVIDNNGTLDELRLKVLSL